MRGLELKRPLVFFDLETTGVDVEKDRIVQIAVLRLGSVANELTEGIGIDCDGWSRREDMWLVNPCVHIPEGASAVHGITDEDVKDMPAFSDISKEVAEWFKDADVCGHNVIKFDIPLLENEMARAGIAFEVDGGVIDTLRIFQARFRHTLECAHRLYAGTWFEGAHDAGNDVDALVKILYGMVEEYPDMPNEPGVLASTPPSPDWIDAEGKFIWINGEATLNFSKNKGQTLKEMFRVDQGFLQWMLGQDFDVTTLRVVRRALKGEFPVLEVKEPAK